MTRILIITVAVLLVLGGVGTALSSAQDPDPGPAIVLDKDPGEDAESGHGTGGAKENGSARDDAKDDYEDARVNDDRDDPFTVALPQPVSGDDDDESDGDDGDDDESDGDDGDDDESDDD